ncbi:hypothetical protein HY310_02840 [Candidatus Microgenomates bacterium]|nr:hypothetical protein [Candidatus Microgenomates bacterium]
MTVYVFGNEDVNNDCQALHAANFLKGKIVGVNFKVLNPNDDIFFDEINPVILDTVWGIRQIRVIRDIGKIQKTKSTTVHDFDLGFQLRYLKKLGKINKVTIIGIPAAAEDINYLRIQSILRKLVAQDMQGS